MQPTLLGSNPDPEEPNRRTKAMRAKFEALVPASARPTTRQPAQIIQLPLWADSRRGVPNSVLRSALFPAIQGKDRKYLQDTHLKTQQGIEIHFTGMQLDQSDLDVWEHALHLARQHPLGAQCRFSAYTFLKDIGRSTGKRDYQWLNQALQRLSGAVVSITHGDLNYFGSLIQGGLRNKAENHYWLRLNPDLVHLYTAGHWTAITWEVRQKLRRKPLALWLHGYYATHVKPYPLKVATIRDLSGSSTVRLRRFKENLSIALAALQETGAITSWQIENDLVHVRTPPRTPTQP